MPKLGQDHRHGQRVGDVGIARLAHLAAMGLLGHDIGPLENRDVGAGVVLPQQGNQGIEYRIMGGRAWAADPLKAGESPATCGRVAGRRGDWSTGRGASGGGLLFHAEMLVARSDPLERACRLGRPGHPSSEVFLQFSNALDAPRKVTQATVRL
jgi:hypothetical protein